MVEISVLIPSHNVEKYIRECLDSIVNQTFEDMEIICVDDGSTDSTLNILNEYALKDSRMRVYENKENKGVGYTRNYLLSLAKGKYIYFMDSDDYLELDAFEKIYKLAEEKRLDMALFKVQHFNDKTKKEFESTYTDMNYLEREFGDRVFSFEDVKEFAVEICVNLPGKLLRRELIRDIKFPNGIVYEDNPFFLEVMIKTKRAYFLREYLYHKRLREESITTTNAESRLDFIYILEFMKDVAKRYDLYEELMPYILQYYIRSNQYMIRRLGIKTRSKYFKQMKECYMSQKNEFEGFRDDIFYMYQSMFDSCIESNHYITYELGIYYRFIKNLKRCLKEIKWEKLMWNKY